LLLILAKVADQAINNPGEPVEVTHADGTLYLFYYIEKDGTPTFSIEQSSKRNVK